MKIRLINPDNIDLKRAHKTWWFWFAAILSILFFYFKIIPKINGYSADEVAWIATWVVFLYFCSIILGIIIAVICTIIEYAVNGESEEIIKFIRDIFK